MNTTIQRFAPAILSFLVLVLGGLAAAAQAGLSGVVLAQLAVLILTTASTYLVPLVGGRWQGALKSGLELAGVAVTLAVPFISTGTITLEQVFLVLVAFVKAVGTELGVVIRTDPVAPVPVVEIAGVTYLEGRGQEKAVQDLSRRAIRAAGRR